MQKSAKKQVLSKKLFGFSLIASLVFQSVGAPLMLGVFLFVPDKVIAQDVDPTTSSDSSSNNESTPETTSPAGESPQSTEATTEESTLEEVTVPVEVPTEVPAEATTIVSQPEEPSSQEKSTEEATPVTEAPKTVCLSEKDTVTQSTGDMWAVSEDGKVAETKENVKLGVKYSFPGSNDTTVVFTCLPADQSKLSSLKIEQIEAANINLPAGVVAASEYAYDITTKMDNGTFKYDLELPKIASGNFDLSYIEKSADEVVGDKLTKDDVKQVAKSQVDNKSESVEATELDHFTTFVVTSAPTVSAASIISGQGCIAEQPGAPSQINCTANDISLAGPTVSIIDGCNFPGDTATVELSVDVDSTATNRYDIGVWMATDGDPNHDGAQSGQCSVANLPAPQPGLNDGDACGDVKDTGSPDLSGINLGTVTVSCQDINNDGLLEVPIITTWDQNSGGVCSSALDTVPGSPSKCKASNNFTIPVPVPGQIVVKKETTPDGATQNFNFGLTGNVSGGFNGSESFQLADGGTWDSGVVIAGGLNAGTYTLTEQNIPSGWSLSSIVCTSADGTSVIQSTANGKTINLVNSDTVTCTFNNTLQKGSLVVQKTTIPAGDTTQFAINASSSTGGTITGSPAGVVRDDLDKTYEVSTGTYSVTETVPAGWVQTNNNCTNRVVGPGETQTCLITNTKQTTLTLVKDLIKDNGGTAVATDWTLSATGPTSISGTTGSSAVTNAVVTNGTYTLSESGPSGYLASAWACTNGITVTDNAITLPLGQNTVCTITNDDIAPRLTVIKHVENDNGGNKNAADFTMNVTGTNVSSSSFAGSETGTTVTLSAGTYGVDEAAAPGYIKTFGANCSGTIALGESKTCTITNDDAAPALTLVKMVTNDNGGELLPSSFTLTATGPTGFSGTGPSVSNGASFDAGTYNLSELGPDGYTAGNWVCVGTGDQVATNAISLELGESATCTITNDDIAPSLTLIKHLTKDNGGSAVATDWTLTATGPSTIAGAGGVASGAAFVAGTYTLSESAGPAGYTASLWSCIKNNQAPVVGASVTVGLGDTVVCSITNDDQQAYIIVNKTVDNRDGGTAGADDFNLTVDGNAALDEVAYKVNPGTHTVGETNLPGYTAGTWGGNCGEDGVVTVALGETKTCTITNDDIAPKLTVTKVVTNDGFGTKVVSDFPLFVNQTSVTSGVQNVYSAGSYTVSETAQAGYTGTIGGDCTASGSVTLGIGETKACTITNNDNFGKLIIEKQTLPDVSTEPFNFTPSYGDGFSLVDGGQNSQILLPATYSVTEALPAGWVQSSVTCSDGSLPGAISLQDGETVTCTFNNTELGNVRIVKDALPDDAQDFTFTNDFGNGNTPEIILDDDADQTLGNGQTSEVLPGTYSVTEGEVAGWRQVSAVCSDESPIAAIVVSPGETVTCTFTNEFIEPILTIDKSNNSTDANPATVEEPGNTVEYTITVTSEEAAAEKVEVTDLPPAGFTYVAGSATAESSNGSHVGPLELSHEYASPGVWSLGTMALGEVITLKYKAIISGSQDDGTYNDLAYAQGQSLRGTPVTATDTADADNFAATRVAVATNVTNTVKIQTEDETETNTKKQYVLGASLPATGASTIILLIALGMLLLGGGLFFGKRKGSMTAKALALGFACSVLLLGGSVAEAANAEMTVSMEQPESAVQTTNFKVGFVALDISERTLTVKCYANGVLYDTHTTIAGGSSGDCQVNSTAMPTEGTYDFYVTAEAEEAPLVTSNHESVTFVSGGPGKPHNYERDDSACRDKITFRTDDDGGRTVGVEVYRSTNKTFTADTPVATLAIGSNTNGEIVVFPPDCNEDYYYAIRAVDASGFGSGFVGDKDIDVTIKNKNQTITLPGTANQGGALPVATEGNAQGGVEVQGAVTGDENGQVLGEATENQEGMGGSFLGWIRNHKLLSTILALLILAGGYWLFLYYRKPRRALPHV